MMSCAAILKQLNETGEYLSPPARRPWSRGVWHGAEIHFYTLMCWHVLGAYVDDVLGRRSDARFINHCVGVLRAVEAAGGRVEIRGTQHLRVAGPVVIVGNHMSTLETHLMPAAVMPHRAISVVIKESLRRYPVFGRVMRSVNPIAVSRTNPREDLVTVLEEGAKALALGRSPVIFPQSTRTTIFDPAQFNTLGVKLAKRGGVPVIPLALKTDFWGNGTRIKDFGAVTPAKTVYLEFGAPLTIHGTGKDEHAQVVAFITACLQRWGGQVAAPATPGADRAAD